MTQKAHMTPLRRNGPFVLVNVLNYGHFNSYAATIARWALASGLEVVFLGHKAGQIATRSGLAGLDGFSAAEISDVCRASCPEVHWGDAAQAKPALGKRCREIVADITHALSPSAILLINADEVFFQNPEAGEPGFTFDAPVYGIVTFGRRDTHYGVQDPYSRRLKATLERRSGFAGLFSIDELHVRDGDPDEAFLHYLPDPYKEFHAAPAAVTAPAAAAAAEEDSEALRAFLAAAPGPIVPILGKFDRRKGNLWILREVLNLPQARVVVLGERVADPRDDAEIDSLLGALAAQGRAFVRFGFLPQEMFDLVFASGTVPCLPLPYRNHTGSSGIQLMAHEHGVPVLAPDFGLMAERVHAHGLGEVFRPGDEADFAVRFAAMLQRGAKPYREGLQRFMGLFGVEAIGKALDGMFLTNRPGQGNLRTILHLRRDLPPHLALADTARRAFAAADIPGAESALAEALKLAPESPGLLLAHSVALWRLDRKAGATAGLQRCMEAGLDEELSFLAQLTVQDIQQTFQLQPALGALTLKNSLLSALPGLSPESLAVEKAPGHGSLGQGSLAHGSPLGQTHLPPRSWQALGGVFAQSGGHAQGAGCFRRAIAQAPVNQEYRLNLSDVLRYAGRFAEALHALDELERLAAHAHGLAHKRGQVLFEQGRHAEAEELFRLEPPESPFYAAAQGYLSRLAGQAAS